MSPDPERRNGALVGVAPTLSASAVEVVIELPAPPGNLAVGPRGVVYFTFHPEAPIQSVKVAEVLPEGGYRAFPSEAWQRKREGAPHFVAPLALRTDRQGRLWVLDHGDYGDETPSLTAFDLASRAMVHRFEFPRDVAGWGSMLNDFVVDERGWIYLAEPGPYTFDPAIVVYDVKRKRAFRVLEDHASVSPADHHLVVQGRFMKAFGLPLQIGVDSIGLSADGETLFYGPLSGDKLYRVPTAILRDETLDESQRAAAVQVLGPKPESDGAVVDSANNVYLTAIEHDGLAVLRPDGTLSLLVQSEALLAWPDGLALDAGERYLYATVSQLHHVIGQDLDELAAKGPFRIVRVALPRSAPESAGPPERDPRPRVDPADAKAGDAPNDPRPAGGK